MPTAYVLINTEPEKMEKVVNDIRKIKGVEEAHMVYGVYDIVAKFKADRMDKLKETVIWNIRRLEAFNINHGSNSVNTNCLFYDVSPPQDIHARASQPCRITPLARLEAYRRENTKGTYPRLGCIIIGSGLCARVNL